MIRREDVLIVDGYNMIGAWPELEPLRMDRLDEARDRLLDWLADFQGYTGVSVTVVFDAFRVPGLGASYRHGGVNVVFTRERETADECIERLVGEVKSVRRNVYVATSDGTEQRIAFGRGALRLSARELRLAVLESRREIARAIRHQPPAKRNPLGGSLSEDMRRLLESWRRGEDVPGG